MVQEIWKTEEDFMSAKKNVSLCKRVRIEQNSIIKENATVGDDVVIFPNMYMGEDTKTADRSII